MDKIEKKDNSAFDFSIKQLVVFSLLLLLLAICISLMCTKRTEKAEAYTNDIQLYSSETITDLTGTTWFVGSDFVASASYGQFNINYNYSSDLNGFFISCSSLNIGYYWDFSPDPTLSPRNNAFCGDIFTYDNYGSSCYFVFVDGVDVSNSSLISWLQANATLQTPQVNTYTISANLNYCTANVTFPLEIEEGQSIYLEFTPFENYIFNTYEWTISPSALNFGDFIEEPFKIAFEINDISSDITINIEAIPYINLKGQWVLKDFSQMSITPTIILNNVNFVSNGYSYNNISALGSDYLRYYSNDLVVNVLSLVDDGLYSEPLSYLPTTTYNYNLITIDVDYYGIFTSELNLPSYLKNVSYFTEIFRRATQSDLDNINYKNGQISILQNEYTFVGMFGALIDAPITALKGLLNFSFFGVNLFSFLTLFITLAVVYLCIKMLKGGRKDE